MASTRLFVSRRQLDTVVRLTDRERAYQIATSGLEAAKGQMDQFIRFLNDPDPATFPKVANAPSDLQPLVTLLLDSEGFPRPAGARGNPSPPLQSFVQELPDVEELELDLELGEGKTLFDSAASSSIPADPREASFLLTLRATAVVGKSTARVVAFKEARVVNITPPVLGKFVLFLRRKGGLDVDSLADALNRDDIDSLPCVIRGGSSAAARSLTVDEASDLIDSQGWIYLGGSGDWELGASIAGGSAAFADGLLAEGQYEYPLEPGSPLAGSGVLVYYAEQKPLYRELGGPAQSEALSLVDPAEYSRSSLLNLFGSAESPSPTLVCGNVIRRWALIQGLRNSSSDSYSPLPYLDSVRFGSSDWPGGARPGTIARIRQQFGEDFEQYRRRMSDVVRQPYNAANLQVIDLGSDDLSSILVLEPGQLPPGAPAQPVSSRLSVDGIPASPGSLAWGNRYTLRDDTGETVFDGGSLDVLEDLSFLSQKSGLEADSEEGLLEALLDETSGQLVLAGAVSVDGDLTFSSPAVVAAGGGGLMLATGDIVIKSGITATDGEPLTLVSLSGDIRIETSQPVEAALIALAGQIRLGKAFDIRGLVSAGELSVELTRDPVTRSIAYNGAFDPTNSDQYRRNYRLQTEKGWRTFVP